MSAPTLHDYQQVAVDFIRKRKRAGLLLDMGLGKTAICLRALQPEHLPALVNAPKRVAENVWHTERAKWRPDLTIAIAAGTPAQRKAALESDADVIVIGRDNLADAVPFAPKFKTHILDELSGFKNRASQRWKAAKKINKEMSNVWGLTGTFTPNGLLDAWAQMYLLDGGEALGTTLGSYRDRYFVPGGQLPSGVIINYNIRPGAAPRIHTLLERTCLSMTTDGRVELPPVTFNDVNVPMSSQVRRVYKAMKEDLVVSADLLGGTETHSAVNAAVLSNKLSQITAGFMYVDDADLRGHAVTPLHKEKVKVAREIQDGTGSPVIIAYNFQYELEMLKEEFGSMAHTVDEPNLQERWNQGEMPVLLAHPASVGHGLNLQYGGHTLIWATLPWSLEEYMQMNKRLARQGQKNPVVIHRLLTPKTVDLSKVQVLAGKQSVQDAVMSHLESPL